MSILSLAERFVGPYPSEDRNLALRLESVGWNVATIGHGVEEVIHVHAGDVVLAVWNIITTTVSGGGTAGVRVGDGNSTARYLADATTTSTAALAVFPYAATDTIDLLVGASATAGAGTVHALIYRP